MRRGRPRGSRLLSADALECIRSIVLSTLLERGPLSIYELEREIDCTTIHYIRVSLQELEECGQVKCEHVRTRGQGRDIAVYSYVSPAARRGLEFPDAV